MPLLRNTALSEANIKYVNQTQAEAVNVIVDAFNVAIKNEHQIHGADPEWPLIVAVALRITAEKQLNKSMLVVLASTLLTQAAI